MGNTNTKQPLWVITTIYNPGSDTWRLRNLLAFRHHLKAPLLVIELAKPGEECVPRNAADIVITLDGDPQIWQKERLINRAVEYLPDSAQYVAWVDADIVFQNPEWNEDAIAQLSAGTQVVQLFEQVSRLPEIDPKTIFDREAVMSTTAVIQKQSVGAALREGIYCLSKKETHQPNPTNAEGISKAYDFTHGIGWAAHRNLFDHAGLYDACVIGGGPSAFAFACMGRPELLFQKRPMSEEHTQHYMEWANYFNKNTDKSIGVVPGVAYHLWHGPYENRRYHERHFKLQQLGFNPKKHLELACNGTWQWSQEASAMKRAVTEYFHSRQED